MIALSVASLACNAIKSIMLLHPMDATRCNAIRRIRAQWSPMQRQWAIQCNATQCMIAWPNDHSSSLAISKLKARSLARLIARQSSIQSQGNGVHSLSKAQTKAVANETYCMHNPIFAFEIYIAPSSMPNNKKLTSRPMLATHTDDRWDSIVHLENQINAQNNAQSIQCSTCHLAITFEKARGCIASAPEVQCHARSIHCLQDSITTRAQHEACTL